MFLTSAITTAFGRILSYVIQLIFRVFNNRWNNVFFLRYNDSLGGLERLYEKSKMLIIRSIISICGVEITLHFLMIHGKLIYYSHYLL